MISSLKDLAFKARYGFKGYPKYINGLPFRLDESLRRFDTQGEEEIFKIIEQRLSHGDTFIDVGANFGMHSLLAAHYVGPAGNVIAFEPVPWNIRLLRKNLSLNGFTSRSHVYECALASQGGEYVPMTIEPGLSPAASLANNFQGNQIQVKATTLDESLGTLDVIPSLVKIDVEGAELEVLKGASETLYLRPDLLIEVHSFALHRFRAKETDIQKYLSRYGYRELRLSSMKSHLGDYYHSLFVAR